MTRFSTAYSNDPQSQAAALHLAAGIEAELGGPDQVAGALLLSTSAAGDEGPEIGVELARRWPEAGLVGTSFEGVLTQGRVWRDQPGFVLLAWSVTASEVEPVSFLLDPPSRSGSEPGFAEGQAALISSALGRDRLDPEDLLLLFPDAHAVPSIEAALPALRASLDEVQIAGAASSGVDGMPAVAWSDDQRGPPFGLAGLWIPGGARRSRAGASSVVTAGASRRASTWLPVTECRSRWIDQLGGQPAIQALRRALRIGPREPLEPQLGRVLAQIRARRAGPAVGVEMDGVAGRDRVASDVPPGRASDTDRDFDEERYIVGLDHGRGAFSLPTDLHRGQELAFALPDADYAREALKRALDQLEAAPLLFQFACRARDASLHGDDDLEPAWVAAHAPDGSVVGTMAPFQIGPGSTGQAQLQVHSTVLAALRSS